MKNIKIISETSDFGEGFIVKVDFFAGVLLQVADALSEYMGLRGNTTAHGMQNRRDKQVQQDAVKASGLRAVRSVCGNRSRSRSRSFG